MEIQYPGGGPLKAGWGPLPAFLGLLLAFAIQLALAAPVAIVDQPSNGNFGTSANIALQIITAFSFVAAPLLVAMRHGAGLRLALAQLGLRPFRRSAFLWMLAALISYLILSSIYVTLFGAPDQEDIAKGFGAVPVQVLLIAIAAPISEEICFRGMLFGGFRARLPALVAALISGLIFGLLHATTGVSAVPPLVVFGVVLALLYEKTGSIVPGMILHMLNNSVALLVVH